MVYVAFLTRELKFLFLKIEGEVVHSIFLFHLFRYAVRHCPARCLCSDYQKLRSETAGYAGESRHIQFVLLVRG